MRVRLDTNVLGGFATHGFCEALLVLFYRDHIAILSARILDEVSRHYRGKFKATKAQAEAVVAGPAACLVTGDQELLALGRFQGVDIVSPRVFYDQLRG